MGKDLIIVESPAKVKTIKKFLGNAYAVEASVGHVRDLPSKKLGVDEDQDFTPQYQIIPGKQKVVSKLKEAAATAGKIYLAPDPDREGEAIAWHVAEILKDAGVPVCRIQFNEITARAVREALSHPHEINENLFLSQQARRILDRLVGYKVSPILWSKVKSGISAGRVQSVALRLVVDREKERRVFVPVEYWPFKARLAGDVPPEFEAELVKYAGKKAVIDSAETAEAAEAAIRGNPFVVTAVTEKERKKSPPPPFITSTLQQTANQRLGYTAKRTMGAAQKLYEGLELGDRGTVALITYMRTDSTRIADEARDATREYIVETLGEEYYPDKARRFRAKAGAQDAHEAIRPVDVNLTPTDVRALLPKDLFALYKLIWERFVASQMREASFWDTAADIKAGPGLFKAKGERLIFPGYLKVYNMEAGDEAKSLPPLAEGQELALRELKKEQKFTLPPPRYTEASLVRELEEKGIGRPSTYAAIISTIIDRDYTRLEDKHFVPSELGETVSDLLSEHFVKIMDVGFTAGMEASLDAVAEGRTDWVALLREFADDFNPTLAKASKDMAKVKAGKETNLTCELCGKPMVIRFGKAGEFLGCSGYPDCKNTKEFDRATDGTILPRERKPEEVASVGTCPQCGKDLVIKKSRTGSRFVACTGWPDCKYTRPFSTGVPCPREGCDGSLVEKSSKRGKVFYACDQYPKCDFAVWDWPVPEHCPECDSKILVRKKTKAGEVIACPNRSCHYRRSVGKKDEEEEE